VAKKRTDEIQVRELITLILVTLESIQADSPLSVDDMWDSRKLAA
jgi:hypothetical protein